MIEPLSTLLCAVLRVEDCIIHVYLKLALGHFRLVNEKQDCAYFHTDAEIDWQRLIWVIARICWLNTCRQKLVQYGTCLPTKRICLTWKDEVYGVQLRDILRIQVGDDGSDCDLSYPGE